LGIALERFVVARLTLSRTAAGHEPMTGDYSDYARTGRRHDSETTMDEKDAAQDESDPTSLNDDELDAASGGKGSQGDQVIIVETGKDQGVIA